MFGIGIPELCIIVLIVFIIFGAGKIPDILSGLGRGLKNFKRELKEIDDIKLD